MKYLLTYYNKHIISKEQYNMTPYLQQHPYYILSGTLSIHPDYILEILKLKTSVETDLDIIEKIYWYTNKHNKLIYDKTLISTYLPSE